MVDARSTLARSEPLRMALLAGLDLLLAVAFFALLLADQARAAGG